VVGLHSLPFCDPVAFPVVWSRLRAALEPGGTLVLTLFGDRDEWAGTKGMTFLTRAELEAVLAGLDVITLDEVDEDGRTAFGTTKHWHIWEVVARRPVLGADPA
jgi:tellurite methyltransferase